MPKKYLDEFQLQMFKNLSFGTAKCRTSNKMNELLSIFGGLLIGLNIDCCLGVAVGIFV
jgi:hypothetical protein